MKEAQTHRSHTRKLVGFTVQVNPTQAISCEMDENMTMSLKKDPKNMTTSQRYGASCHGRVGTRS